MCLRMLFAWVVKLAASIIASSIFVSEKILIAVNVMELFGNNFSTSIITEFVS